jgi:glycosyltransferase involved in cell wall biosynthesis
VNINSQNNNAKVKFLSLPLLKKTVAKSTKKRIIVSVTSDLVTDNRVHKVCTSLLNMGFDVLLVGRKKNKSLPLHSREYKTQRMKLLFETGPFFYACVNFRLFFILLFSKFDVLLANDLDVLPANFIISKWKRKPLVYDSHEYFTESPELVHRPKVQHFWEWMEKKMLPKIKNVYTVCESIAKIYTEKYGVNFRVVRNIPDSKQYAAIDNHGITSDKKIILYQGAVNMGRGLEQAIRSMKYIEGAKLIIAGDGYLKPELEKLVLLENLSEKVEFKGLLPPDKLSQLTPLADLGLSIEEDLGLNYRYALPNKLFDYIQAQVPVLVTNLPEMTAIVKKYNIGEITTSLDPKMLAEKVKSALFNENSRAVWKKNLKTAAKELVWENEEKVLKEIFSQFIYSNQANSQNQY